MAASVNDLIEFLIRCNDEDEAAARGCCEDVGVSADTWKAGKRSDGAVYVVDGYGDGVIQTVSAEAADEDSVANHIALHDPARVLRECAARRRLIERVKRMLSNPPREAGPEGQMDACIECLMLSAQSYADRSRFRDEWRVT